MALSTIGDIQTQFLVTNNRTTTDSFITDTTLNNWTRDALKWTAGFKKWPMTEGRVSTTFSTASEEWTFEGYKPDSFRLLQIGGKRFDKLNFLDYQAYKEDQTSGTDKVFSDFGGIVYINTLADASGTLTAWGQYIPNVDPTDKTATTVFSGIEEEAHEATIYKMTSYLKDREHLTKETEYYEEKAKLKLEEVWKRYADEQFGYQTKDRSIFKRIDVLAGANRDDFIRRDQFF